MNRGGGQTRHRHPAAWRGGRIAVRDPATRSEGPQSYETKEDDTSTQNIRMCPRDINNYVLHLPEHSETDRMPVSPRRREGYSPDRPLI